MNDREQLKVIEAQLIDLIQDTTHYRALEHLTVALMEVRKCSSCLDGGCFYEGLKN